MTDDYCGDVKFFFFFNLKLVLPRNKQKNAVFLIFQC